MSSHTACAAACPSNALGSDVRISDLQEFVKDNCRTAKIKNITKDISSSYGENPKTTFLCDASMGNISRPGEKSKRNIQGERILQHTRLPKSTRKQDCLGTCAVRRKTRQKTAGLSGRRSVFVWCGKWGLAAGRDFYESTAAVPHSRVLGGGNRFSHYHTRV